MGSLRVHQGGRKIAGWLAAWRAAWALTREPRPISVQKSTQDAADGDQWELCWSAAGALTAIGAPAVPGLIDVLHSSSASSQRAAAHALGRIGRVAYPAVPDLIRLLDARHPRAAAIADAAADALVLIGAPALPGLLPVMGHPNLDLRRTATKLVGQIAADHPNARLRHEAVTRLLLGLRDDEAEVCRVSAEGLGLIAQVHPELVLRIAPSLLPLLKDKRESVRSVTSRALEAMGDEVVPILAGALESTSETLRIEVSRVLRRIGTPDALSVLEEG
jgi:HEAT repeat protein